MEYRQFIGGGRQFIGGSSVELKVVVTAVYLVLKEAASTVANLVVSRENRKVDLLAVLLVEPKASN